MQRRRLHARFRRHTMTAPPPADHVDAWLMSYADLITLLFMLFVVLVSLTATKHEDLPGLPHGEKPHPVLSEHTNLLPLGNPHDKVVRSLTGIVSTNSADQDIGIDKRQHGAWIDISSVQFFEAGSADIPAEQLPVLQAIAQTIKNDAPADDQIEVEGYTDDVPLGKSPFRNNWELSAMRAARIVSLLIDAGIEPQRLRATSYAGNRAIVPNTDEAGNPIDLNRSRNQRVMIKLVGRWEE